MKNNHFLSMTLIAVAILAGCNSTKHNPTLADAHDNYNNASNNPDVTSMAALELKEASDSLVKADQALSQGENATTVDHLAYLASQKVAIAQETAKRKAAELAVADARVMRTQASLDARTAEADASKRQVAIMQSTADQQSEELAAASANAVSDQALISKQAMLLRELNAKQTKRGLVITLGDVLFSTNKSQLKSGGMHNVQKLADFLKDYPKHKVLIEGYTDSIGSEELNQKLSERRANNVRRALVDVMGINPNRITTRGYGEEFPVASNDSDSNRQLNRRVEIIISDENGNISLR
jgi:outer membrane protein OmpA-like peptidoglycan-associated protein